jgi:hypothetical protein
MRGFAAREEGDMRIRSGLAVVLAVAAFAAAADDREAYNRRAAEADMAAFRALDVNRDGMLTRDEARGAVYFAPRFDDIDTNRDGVITLEEMRRYLERTYGVRPAA